jgi:hypothetical protein
MQHDMLLYILYVLLQSMEQAHAENSNPRPRQPIKAMRWQMSRLNTLPPEHGRSQQQGTSRRRQHASPPPNPSHSRTAAHPRDNESIY